MRQQGQWREAQGVMGARAECSERLGGGHGGGRGAGHGRAHGGVDQGDPGE